MIPWSTTWLTSLLVAVWPLLRFISNLKPDAASRASNFLAWVDMKYQRISSLVVPSKNNILFGMDIHTLVDSSWVRWHIRLVYLPLLFGATTWVHPISCLGSWLLELLHCLYLVMSLSVVLFADIRSACLVTLFARKPLITWSEHCMLHVWVSHMGFMFFFLIVLLQSCDLLSILVDISISFSHCPTSITLTLWDPVSHTIRSDSSFVFRMIAVCLITGIISMFNQKGGSI